MTAHHLIHPPLKLLGTLVVLCAALLLLGCQDSTNPVAPAPDDATLASAKKPGGNPGGEDPLAWVEAVMPDGLDFNAEAFVSTCYGTTGLANPNNAFWNWQWSDLRPIEPNCVTMVLEGSDGQLDRVKMKVITGKGRDKNKITGIILDLRRKVSDTEWAHYATKEISRHTTETGDLPDWTMEVRRDNIEVWRIKGSRERLIGNRTYLYPVHMISVGDIRYSEVQQP